MSWPDNAYKRRWVICPGRQLYMCMSSIRNCDTLGVKFDLNYQRRRLGQLGPLLAADQLLWPIHYLYRVTFHPGDTPSFLPVSHLFLPLRTRNLCCDIAPVILSFVLSLLLVKYLVKYSNQSLITKYSISNYPCWIIDYLFNIND